MGKLKKKRLAELSIERRIEIARYCIKSQHLTHKQRAYYLGLHYSTYMTIFHEMIAVYSVFVMRDEVLPSLTEKTFEERYITTCFGK